MKVGPAYPTRPAFPLGDGLRLQYEELNWAPLTMAEKPWLETLHQHLVDSIATTKEILASQPTSTPPTP